MNLYRIVLTDPHDPDNVVATRFAGSASEATKMRMLLCAEHELSKTYCAIKPIDVSTKKPDLLVFLNVLAIHADVRMPE